jgi:hypothetical protein
MFMAITGKRGSMLVIIAIITLVVALIVLIMYPMIANTYASGKVAYRTATARDIALILDAMYAYPYDIEIEYDFDFSEFLVEISEKKVKVRDKSFSGISDKAFSQYPFVPVNDDPAITLDGPTKIVFKKEKGVLTATQ